MKLFFHIGLYFLMIGNTFRKFTKWPVLKILIFKEIDDLIIRSFGIVAFISLYSNILDIIILTINDYFNFLKKNHENTIFN